MPAPRLNLNAASSGQKVRRLTVGELPRQLGKVKAEGRAYRRDLEDAVLEQHGDVSIMHAHWIDTAAACTIHAGIMRWLLREKMAKMTPAEIANCSREITKAKQQRDQSVVKLQLERDKQAELIALYSAEVPSKAPGSPPADRRAKSG